MDKLFNQYSFVIRLNIQETVEHELASAYDFQYTPTFIIFDAQGKEVWRQMGALDPEKVRQTMK